MTALHRAIRFCFVALFAAVSLLHGPVMTFAGTQAQAAPPAAMHERDHHHAGADTPQDPARHEHGKGGQAGCNAFACFLAVAPDAATARHLHAVLLGVLAAAPAPPVTTRDAEPATPPPRLQA